MVIYSSPNSNLKELQRRIPFVSDKALVDLVNGIQVSKDIIRYRKNRIFFGKLLDTLTGKESQRQMLLDGNLIAGQETLYQWVLELSDSLRISQLALQVTQQSLLETRDAIRRQKARLERQENAVEKLIEVVSKLYQELKQRCNEIEARIRRLEVRVAANEDLDRIISAWLAEQTYTRLPWPLQVPLLAREVFSSSVIIYERQTGDLDRFRSLLINKIIAEIKHLIPPNFFGFAEFLDQSWQTMTESDRELTAALLEVRSIPHYQLQNIPLLFTLGTTLELATLPQDARPPQPGKSAIALCRSQIDMISYTIDAREFVTKIVQETAYHCLAMLPENDKL